jgi:hypothetical protein
MEGHGIHGSGFHAPFYFRFEAWKRTAKGNTKEAKEVPPPPPPWFPPLDSSFRGAPSARNDQRGKPIPTTARKAKCSRLRGPWGSGANRFVVCPLGHVLCSLLFSPLAGGRTTWPRPSPLCPAMAGLGAKAGKWLWVSGPEEPRA